MGLPKAMLPFGPELMLQRITRVLLEVVEPVVVVAAADQQLPDLPSTVMVTRDEREGRGPLEGLRVGLAAIASHADAAYVTSCDAPLLSPEFVRRMIAELGELDAAVPVEDKFYHPLAAVYRTNAVATIEQLLNQETRRTSELFVTLLTNRVPIKELRGSDPDLLSLMNVNTPSDYANALNLAGFPIDPTVSQQPGL